MQINLDDLLLDKNINDLLYLVKKHVYEIEFYNKAILKATEYASQSRIINKSNIEIKKINKYIEILEKKIKASN